jgi:hypothetical protein
VLQADGKDYRNVLLSEKWMNFDFIPDDSKSKIPLFKNGLCFWSDKEVEEALHALGIYHQASLSVLAVETFPNNSGERVAEPLGKDLGQLRFYRTSQLEPVSQVCCTDC